MKEEKIANRILKKEKEKIKQKQRADERILELKEMKNDVNFRDEKGWRSLVHKESLKRSDECPCAICDPSGMFSILNCELCDSLNDFI